MSYDDNLSVYCKRKVRVEMVITTARPGRISGSVHGAALSVSNPLTVANKKMKFLLWRRAFSFVMSIGRIVS